MRIVPVKVFGWLVGWLVGLVWIRWKFGGELRVKGLSDWMSECFAMGECGNEGRQRQQRRAVEGGRGRRVNMHW